jgi:nicotinamide mononucleotide transporter
VSLDPVLDPLRATAFTLFGAPTSRMEVIGFVTGALCVWLVARQNPWNWPIGMVNNVAFFALFTTAGLYADAWLQVVYLGLACYGWWRWVRVGDPLAVSRTSAREWRGLAVACVLGTALLTWLLVAATDSTVPFWDALTTVLSLLATWGQARKKVECWWLWIAADVIYVPLYGYKELWLTAILYIGFMALCAHGLRRWSADLRAGAAV